MDKWPGTNRTYWGIQWHQPTGSFNVLSNRINISVLRFNDCSNVTGDLETFTNWYKLYYLYLEYIYLIEKG